MTFTADALALAERLGGVLIDATVFVLVAALVYLPGRYLVVPAARWAMDEVGVDDTWELPALKVLTALFVILGVFAGGNLSGLANFLQATEAVFAAATIALGFAAQDVLGNLVSGVFIVTDPEFNIGDWVVWDGKEGIIEDISFRVTRIHTFDNELITVPNGELTATSVTNLVAKDTRRITYTFCVAYGTDLERARSVLVETARAQETILDRPAPNVGTIELGDSCVELQARFWIDQPARSDVVRVRARYVSRVLEAFDEAGIEMPYPTQALTGEVTTRTAPAEQG
jgi:small-conductance mechanosensitive channel